MQTYHTRRFISHYTEIDDFNINISGATNCALSLLGSNLIQKRLSTSYRTMTYAVATLVTENYCNMAWVLFKSFSRLRLDNVDFIVMYVGKLTTSKNRFCRALKVHGAKFRRVDAIPPPAGSHMMNKRSMRCIIVAERLSDMFL